MGDKNDDGKMTKDEVLEFLQTQDKDTFTEDVCEALYKDANKDGDGGITVKEFREWLEKTANEQEALDKVEKKEEEEAKGEKAVFGPPPDFVNGTAEPPGAM